MSHPQERSNNERRHEADPVRAGHGLGPDRARHAGQHLRRAQGLRHEGGAEAIFAEKIETPFGPAAGPNTQLAQNIIASYVAGSRFFELKTVQVMDGEELSACVNKPASLPRTSATTASGPPSSPCPTPSPSTSRPGGPASSSPASTAWATRTALSSTCPWATASRASSPRRSTRTSRA